MLPINKRISAYNHYNYNNPKYIVVHYVGGQSSTAKNNVDYFYGGDRQASAHYFVDDTSIWQSVEDNKGAWHVGNTRTEVNNQNSIGIEMCCMGANLMVTAKTEANTIELVRYLMKKYNIPIANVRTHYEVSGKTKVCPNWSANNWARWNAFKNKVVNGTTSAPSTPPSSTQLYRIRKTWADAKSQVGAYSNLESAKSQCPTGYSVFDSNGKCVYTKGTTTTTVLYRVKTANGTQLGAFGSLDNAKKLAQKKQAIVYDNDGKVVVSYVPTKKYLNLSPNVASWRVYPTNVAPIVVNACGSLAPKTFGGLSYEILANPQADVYTIMTSSFGRVNIYAPRDNDSSITTYPLY